MINYDQLELICRLATILNACESDVGVQDLINYATADARGPMFLCQKSHFTLAEARVEMEMLKRALDMCTQDEERVV